MSDDPTETGGDTASMPVAEVGDGPGPAPGAWRKRIMLWGGVLGGVVGIALAVVGFLGFSAASDDDDDAARARRQRQELTGEETTSSKTRQELSASARSLIKEIETFDGASTELSEAEAAVSDALNRAVDAANAGDLNGARAQYEGQAGAVADLEAKLTKAREALDRAKQKVTELQRKQGAT